MSPVQHDSVSAEADALFEEAREAERRRRRSRRNRSVAVVLAALIVAGGIGFSGGGDHHGGSLGHASGAAASSTSKGSPRSGSAASTFIACSPAAVTGGPPPGQCIVLSSSGTRYQCRAAVAQNFSSDKNQAAGNSACHEIPEPTIPASWQPIVRQMSAVKACLGQAGLALTGSAIPDSQADPYTSVAGVLIAGSTRPGTLTFYSSASKAKAAYALQRRVVSGQGARLARDGRVLYDWNSQSDRQEAIERRCVEHA